MSVFSPRQVTSLANPLVKTARGLHQRKDRVQTGQFLAEGLKIVTEAVDCGRTPSALMFGPDAREHPVLRRVASATLEGGGEVVEVTREILEKISRRENPQTVVAIFNQVFTPVEQFAAGGNACLVALEVVRDPGNLGTIIRTADAAGCRGVILVGDCCDPYSVEAVRATMGSIFVTALARTSVPEFLAWRHRWPGSVVGALLSAETDYRAAEYRRPTLILMGNEQSGLTPELARACDVAVKIPMLGRADSLNLAVATGIMIYAAIDDGAAVLSSPSA